MNGGMDLGSMTGKTVVVTGATSGIGLETARELIRRGAFVIGTGRSGERCEEAERQLGTEAGTRVRYLTADLSSQRQVRRLAEAVRACASAESRGHIDVLVNNAGTFSGWYALTEDGLELQFAVNHLAPFLLTHLLMPVLRKSPQPRVITVSSGSHYRTRMNWDDIFLRKRYNCLAAYKQSKLATVLFTFELARRLGEEGRAFAADPGLVDTAIGEKSTAGLAKWIWKNRRRYGSTPGKGAETSVHLAAAYDGALSHDIYWKDCRPKEPSGAGRDGESARKLWEISERICGIRSEDWGLGE